MSEVIQHQSGQVDDIAFDQLLHGSTALGKTGEPAGSRAPTLTLYFRGRDAFLPTASPGTSPLISTYSSTGATAIEWRDMSWPTTTTDTLTSERVEGHAANWALWARKVGEVLKCAVEHRPKALSGEARLRADRLANIQASLGFTVQDLATVLSISRPQVYRWLSASDDVRLQRASRERLSTIERIASFWRSRTPAPLRSVARSHLANGTTVFELLAADQIDEPAVRAALEEAHTQLQAASRTPSQRLADAGFTRRPSARALPSDE